jgi:hypothetical protein
VGGILSEAGTCIHKKVMGTVPVFWARSTITADRDQAVSTLFE